MVQAARTTVTRNGEHCDANRAYRSDRSQVGLDSTVQVVAGDRVTIEKVVTMFTSQDRAGAQPVIMINETMSRRLWPGEDPIGKRLRLGGPSAPEAEVVGVAVDGKYATLGENARSFTWRPLLQSYSSKMTLVVRTTGNPEALSAAIREQIQSLDPNLPVTQITTLAERVDFALFSARLGAALLGAFGLLALSLASTGIYGVIAYYLDHRNDDETYLRERSSQAAALREVIEARQGTGLRDRLRARRSP